MLKRVTDYPAHLEACWREHLEPKEKNAPTVISTFAGAGGSSLGYSMAGFRELLAVEWDDNAVETFKMNFSDVPVYHGDIAKISVDEVLSMTGLKVGELDVLDGSPPCQGFSTAGKRQLDDPRNQLFREYVRLLRGLKPKVFIMENVSGMVKGLMKLVFAEIMRELKASGYKVSARLLNAMYFGVPQSRERMIFIGVRDDLGVEPSHPKAETIGINFEKAIIGVEDYIDRKLPDILTSYADKHPDGKWSTDVKIYEKEKGNMAGSFSLKWAYPHMVLGTIPKSEISITGIVHPNRIRYLNMSELKRCGSFPDTFDMLNRENAINRIGNSVPPLFMRSIALHVRNEILAHTGGTPELIE